MAKRDHRPSGLLRTGDRCFAILLGQTWNQELKFRDLIFWFYNVFLVFALNYGNYRSARKAGERGVNLLGIKYFLEMKVEAQINTLRSGNIIITGAEEHAPSFRAIPILMLSGGVET